MGLTKVLLVGINYVENKQNQLYGCINDIANMEKIIKQFYPECKDIVVLRDADAENKVNTNKNLKPSKKNIVDGINWLVKDLKAGDSVYFHYSGHGGLVRDVNRDELTGMDSCIYPCNDGNIEMILDDELKVLLVNRIPKGAKCFVVMDCCHCGTGLDLKYSINTPRENTITFSQNPRYRSIDSDIVLLSGSADSQTSADTVDEKGTPSGALTNALVKMWKESGIQIRFKHMLWQLRKNLKEDGYSQIPQITTGKLIGLNDEFKL